LHATLTCTLCPPPLLLQAVAAVEVAGGTIVNVGFVTDELRLAFASRASPFNVESVITLLISKATVSSGSGAAPLRVAVAAAIAIACKRCGAGHGRGPARLMAPSHRAVPSSIIIILDGCTLWSVPCVGAASVATAPNDLLFWQSLGGCGYRGVKLIRCLLLRACDLTRLLALTDALVPHSFQIFICQQSVLSSMPVLLPLFLHPFLVHLRTG